MTFAQSLTQLNILLSNTSGFTFNTDETNQILTDTWNDKYAVNPIVWDESLTFSISNFTYAIPATLTTVSEIYITRSSTDFPTPLDRKLWRVVGANIKFFDGALQVIPDGYTLRLKGRYKVTTSDTITDTGLEQYLVALAGYNALRYLLLKRTMQFLKNDTSVAEIVATRRELYADVVRWRQQLQAEFMGV
jgi:hypothetical protein